MSFIQSGNEVAVTPNAIVCQRNISVGVQALAWFCQTKVWTPFSESRGGARAVGCAHLVSCPSCPKAIVVI
jgi:hypothetical protein